MASSIEKTFRCIEALARAPEGLTIAEIVSLTGFSRPAATRLIESLEADAIAVREPTTRRYKLGMRLYEWVTVSVQASTPMNLARREFVRLAGETGRQFNFLVLEEPDVILIESAFCLNGVPVTRAVAARRAWHETASGKSIVAHLAPAATKAILDRTGRRLGLAKADAERLAIELEGIRRTGYGHSVDDNGKEAIGVPIFGQAGYAVAAIGTYLEQDNLADIAVEKVLSHMLATATRVSEELGHHLSMAARVT